MTSYTATKSPLLALIADGLISRFGFGLITFALPFYGLTLGMSYAEVGILAALRPLTAVLLKPLMGHLIDKVGQRRMYIAALVGRCLVAILFVLATQVWTLFLIRFLHGATSAARDPAAALLISTHGGNNKLASAFAWYGSAREVGAALGIVCAGLVLTTTQDFYPFVFLSAAIVSVIGLLVSLIYIPADSAPDDAATRHRPARESGAYAAPSEWLVYAVLGMAMATTGAMLVQMFPVLAVDYAGLTKAETSYILAVALIISVFASPLFGYVADVVSRHMVLSLRALLNVVSTTVYWVAPSFGGFISGRIADDLGKGAFRPAWGAMMAELAERDNKSRGKTLAYLDTSQSAGEALGPIFAGWVWDEYGVVALFASRIGLSVVAELYALWVLRRRQGG